MEDPLADLRQQIHAAESRSAALEEALRGLSWFAETGSDRLAFCWCQTGTPPEGEEHEEACVRARATLVGDRHA
jgi:hypothetical protein